MTKPLEMMVPRDAEDRTEVSPIVIPEEKALILGGNIELHINALLVKHVTTARALERTIKSQQALGDTMDQMALLLQDPTKTIQEAVRVMMNMQDLQKQLKEERASLELEYNNQEAEFGALKDGMEKAAKNHPELFVLGTAAEA